MNQHDRWYFKYGRAIVVTSPIAFLFAGAMFLWPQASALYKVWVTNAAQDYADPIRAIGSSVGLAGFITWVSRHLLTDWFPLTAGFFASQILSGLALLPAIRGTSFTDLAWPAFPAILDPVIYDETANSIEALSRSSKFRGRTEEMTQLLKFARSDDAPGLKFAVVTGGEGVGKTRLAREWLSLLHARDWDVGLFIRGTDELSVRSLRFRKKTAIVIDDAGRVDDVWQIIAAIPKAKFRVRILVVDQFVRRPPPSLSAQILSTINAASTISLHLSGLSASDLRLINPDITAQVIALSDGRPLFALLGDDPAKEIERRAARRLDKAVTPQDRELLALAALVGPFRYDKAESQGGGPRSLEHLQTLFEGTSKDVLSEEVPSLGPSPLANAVAIQALMDMPKFDCERVFTCAIDIHPMAVQLRLSSILRETEQSDEKSNMISMLQEALDKRHPEIRAGLLHHIIDLDGSVRTDPLEIEDILSAVEEAGTIARLRSTDREIVATAAAIFANSSLRLCEAGYSHLVLKHLAFVSANMELMTQGGTTFTNLITNGMMFSSLAHTGRFRDAEGAYLQIKPIFFDVLNNLNSDSTLFREAQICLPAALGGAFLLATATSNEEMLDDSLRTLAKALKFLPSRTNDSITMFVDAICVAVHYPVNYFASHGRPERIITWINRFMQLKAELASRLPQLQEVHDTLNSTIAILNGQMIVAYGQQGDVGAMERRAARLLAEISMPANILNEETKIRLRGEIATGAVQTYCTRGDLQNAERWAKTATAKWKVTSTSPHDEVRNTMVGIAGIMLQYFNSGDKEFPMRFRRWASIADHLWKEEEQEVPDRPVVAGLIQTCSEVQLYKAFTRDADGVHQWMKRLVTCADHPPYRSNPQICGEVASCLFNAVTTIWNEYPREEIRSWRLSLLELVSRFPDDAYIQTLGANIPDLWHTGWSQAIHEKTKHMLTSYTG